MIIFTAMNIGLAGCAFVLYLIVGAIYRLYFSPIAKFPGPKIAALTLWYEFYHDVICRGQYTFKIEEMHKKYGPIIRINPHELHIETPEYLDELYGAKNNYDRYEWMARSFGIPKAIFSTVPAKLHRMRRAPLSPFFSKVSVLKLQPEIQNSVGILMKRLVGFRKSGEPMTISLAYAALTNDVVQEYAFARSDHRLESKDFDPSFHDASVTGTIMGPFVKQMPWFLDLMQSLPDSITILMDPNMASYVKLQRDVAKQVAEITSGSSTMRKDAAHPTIFHEIINSDLPASEKSTSRLAQDGQVMVIAGTLTTAWTLSVATYYLLAQPGVLRTLKDELSSAIPDTTSFPDITALEQLPYLKACIKESLRLSYGVSHRLQRVSPEKPMLFNDGKKDWYIAAGTAVGMTCTLIHHNPTIYPSPRSFDPSRWLSNPRLDRYLCSFGKGPRQCLGINLAYAELYLILATVFRSYGSVDVQHKDDAGYLELFETDKKDVEMIGDAFIPLVKRGSKGINVLVRSCDSLSR